MATGHYYRPLAHPGRRSGLSSPPPGPALPAVGPRVLSRALMRHPPRPGCPPARPGEPDCPAITDQCVPLSAARHRPERRSDDGQMTFKALPAARESGPDLGFCGAPLRNRTVDLLLTIGNFLGSLPGSMSAEPAAAVGPAAVATLRSAGKTRRPRDTVRASPGLASGVRHTVQDRSAGLSADWSRSN